MHKKTARLFAPTIALAFAATCAVSSASAVTISVAPAGKAISPDIFGIFFEDINYGADGGLYGELIQNRSFQYQPVEQKNWNPLSYWDLVTRGGGAGSLTIEAADPLNANNPTYAVLEVRNPGEGVGLSNPGFDGIPVRAGEKYDFSSYAKLLYLDSRWSAHHGPLPELIARIESRDGQSLGEVTLTAPGRDWTHLTATITAQKTDPDAHFVLLATQKCGLAFGLISLFPEKTFHGHPNGLRPDLAQTIADLHPKFMRFPGGCVSHGNGLGNIYRWKDTVGPIEQRRGQANIWGYHQSVGLGYFEFFQFCEDIGAKPLPVIAAGVCCQNSDHTGGEGQRGIPLAAMPAYIQDIQDLIEWANGPTNSTWGAVRAAAGHPAPFGLQYIGIGNEDAQTDVFRERFKMIYDAVKAKHPEITIVGTVGPSPDGSDYDAGWKFARANHVDMVDEHYYERPQWFLDNQHRYDAYDRSAPKVYVGEYASQGNALFNALAEATYMTSLERNGDVVHFASYAPLLAKQNRTQWHPDMIYFNNTDIVRSANYYVQQLFAQNEGDEFLPATVSASPSAADQSPAGFAISCVRDTKSGDLVLKLVNVTSNSIPARINFAGSESIQLAATRIVLTGDPSASNDYAHPGAIAPVESSITAGKAFDCEVPAFSLSVLRVKTR